MPNEPLKALNTPNTGDLVGAWGTAAVNPNMQVIGGLLGGVVSVSLTNTNVSLTISTGVIGTGSITPGAGPVQSDNAVIKFIGTLTGNCTITFPAPGFWIVENNCTVGSFYVQARAAGTGNVVGLPPGEPIHVYNDGTDCKFVDMGRVGSYMRLAVQATPAWMSACTVLPYLPCVSGSATYTSSVYPALAVMMGSTFGGNGVTTFGVPDKSNRVGIPLGTRISATAGGFDGNILGITGGTTTVTVATSHLPTNIPYSDSGHRHPARGNNTPGGGSLGSPANNYPGDNGLAQWSAADNCDMGINVVSTAAVGIVINSAGSNTPFNILQPTIVDGIEFIKT